MTLEELKLPDLTKLKQFHKPVNFIIKQDPTADLLSFIKELFTQIEYYCNLVQKLIFHVSLKPFIYNVVSTASGQQLFFSFFHEPQSLFLYGSEIKFVTDIPSNTAYAIGRSYLDLKQVDIISKNITDDYPEIAVGILPKNINKYANFMAFL